MRARSEEQLEELLGPGTGSAKLVVLILRTAKIFRVPDQYFPEEKKNNSHFSPVTDSQLSAAMD